mmetsp:Transcript_8574/g.31703  ORF Transcript_8574/g.31703 Transcript_8574/m.31703 type:complete len:150 (+) Transcript_8574:881-1330(+)
MRISNFSFHPFTTTNPSEMSSTQKIIALKYSTQEMEEMRIPHQYRNPCAHLHVKYTDCQVDKNGYVAPWRCQLEEARLKRCLYKLWLRDLRLSDQMYRAEYKLRLIYEELEKKGVKLPMAQRWSLRDSEVLAQHFVQGKSDGSEEETNL